MRNKYKNVKTIYNGIKFDSKKEAEFCAKLDLLKKAIDDKERVIDYELQPRYDIIINGKHCGFYKADFKVYYKDTIKIYDVKGMRTTIYKLKKKIIEALYGIKIIEV